jgi:hypothetical protein
MRQIDEKMNRNRTALKNAKPNFVSVKLVTLYMSAFVTGQSLLLTPIAKLKLMLYEVFPLIMAAIAFVSSSSHHLFSNAFYQRQNYR